MLNEKAKGVFTIAATPFRENGELDLNSLDSAVDFYLSKGATGLTVLGMMGEAGKLDAAEAQAVAQRTIERAGVPVVVGVSAPGFAQMKALAVASMDLGAAGVMVAPPSSLRTNEQILTYYHGVAETLGEIPFVLQDFPLVTNVQVPVSVILQIVEDCATCVMLKHEDWPGLEKIAALRGASQKGSRRISILCGNGGMFLPEEMARGADGAMTGFSYPEMMSGVVAAFASGNVEAMHDIFDAYLPLARYENQPGLGLAIRKYVLMRRGAIASAALRTPSPKLSPATVEEVERLISRQEVALSRAGITA